MLVGQLHGPAECFHQLCGPQGGLRVAVNPRGQRAAGNMLHGEIPLAVVRARLVDLHDVRILKAGDSFDLGA
jgi:hypothetical protein